MPPVIYYCLNYFYDRKNSGSFPFRTTKKLNTDEEIIEEALSKKVLDSEDARQITDIEVITQDEYRQMKNA